MDGVRSGVDLDQDPLERSCVSGTPGGLRERSKRADGDSGGGPASSGACG